MKGERINCHVVATETEIFVIDNMTLKVLYSCPRKTSIKSISWQEYLEAANQPGVVPQTSLIGE